MLLSFFLKVNIKIRQCQRSFNVRGADKKKKMEVMIPTQSEANATLSRLPFWLCVVYSGYSWHKSNSNSSQQPTQKGLKVLLHARFLNHFE